MSRKVQKVGYSTLVVSLPKDWANETGIKRGDTVMFRKEGDGTLKIFPEVGREQEKFVKSVIDADKCHEREMLTRVLTGNYVLGHDAIEVVSKSELRPEHMQEIRNTTRRLTGIGIVEQTIRKVTIQSFVDQTKFPVDGLIRRLYILTWSMQDAAMSALLEHRPELAEEALRMEEEVDRIYWLITRQLLLAAQDTSMMKKIGLKSTRAIVSNRLITKCIEEMADYAENMAKEVLSIKDQDYTLHPDIREELSQLNRLVQTILDKTMKGQFTSDLGLANNVIETVKQADERRRKIVERILTQVSNISAAISLKSITWSLRQVARMCDVIAEITINGILSSSTEICRYEET